MRAPFENLMSDAAALFASNIVCAGETPLPDRLGRPDYAVLRDGRSPVMSSSRRRASARTRGDSADATASSSGVFRAFPTSSTATATNGSGGRCIAAASAPASSASPAMSPPMARRRFPRRMRARSLGCCAISFFGNRSRARPQRQDRPQGLRGDAGALCRMLRDDVTDALRGDASPLAILAGTGGNFCSPTPPTRNSPIHTRRRSPSRCCWAAAKAPTR